MNAPHLVKAISDRRAFQLGAEEFQPLLPRRAVIATIGTATIGTATVEPPPLKPPRWNLIPAGVCMYIATGTVLW